MYSKFQLVKINQVCWVAISFIELPCWFKDYFALISGAGWELFSRDMPKYNFTRNAIQSTKGAIELNVGKFR